MKYLATAAAFVAMTTSAFVATTTSAFADEVVFQGDVFFTATDVDSAACKPLGFVRYDYLRASFRPKNSINGTQTQFNLTGARFAYHVAINGSLTGSGSYNGAGFGSRGTMYTWASTFASASTSPTDTVTAKSVAIKVVLHNFSNTTGCTVTLQGTLGLRPDL